MVLLTTILISMLNTSGNMYSLVYNAHLFSLLSVQDENDTRITRHLKYLSQILTVVLLLHKSLEYI